MNNKKFKKTLILIIIIILTGTGCSLQNIKDTFDSTINTQFKPNKKEKRRLNGIPLNNNFDYFDKYHMNYSTHTEETFSTADLICYLDKGDLNSAKYMLSPRARDLIPNIDKYLQEIINRIGNKKIKEITTLNTGGLRTNYDESYTWATGRTFTTIKLKDGTEWTLTILTTPYYAEEIKNLPDDLLKREKIIKKKHKENKASEWMNKYYIGINTICLQSSNARESSNNHNFYHINAYKYKNNLTQELENLFPKGYIGYANVGHEELNLKKDYDIKYVDYTYGIVIYD